MPEAATVRAPTADAPVLHWLALSLTPGLGPLKARKIAEHFGSAENVLKATLTELEGTGMQAVSAQSLATGRSLELAHDELGRAAQAIRPLFCMCAETRKRSRSPESQSSVRVIPHPTGWAWPNASLVIWPRAV